MSEAHAWTDSSREQLRKTLRSAILGELRLSKRSRQEILGACLEIHILEECPENEWNELIQFSADEFERASSRLSAEKATWPVSTDCDRLDDVEAALREQGILMPVTPDPSNRPDREPDVLGAIGHPARRRMQGLLIETARSVNALAGHFQMNRPAVSQRLRVLLAAGPVTDQRYSPERRYRLVPAQRSPIRDSPGVRCAVPV